MAHRVHIDEYQGCVVHEQFGYRGALGARRAEMPVKQYAELLVNFALTINDHRTEIRNRIFLCRFGVDD